MTVRLPRGVRRSATATALPLRAVEHVEATEMGGLFFQLQRPLTNFNSGFGGGNRHGHWSHKAKARKAWQAALINAMVSSFGFHVAQLLLTPESGLAGAVAPRPEHKRAVAFTRLVPHRRQFVRDEFDNLRWCTKELRDALSACGLIRDDASKWCDTTIGQAVSEDGTCWTHIRIEQPIEVSQ